MQTGQYAARQCHQTFRSHLLENGHPSGTGALGMKIGKIGHCLGRPDSDLQIDCCLSQFFVHLSLYISLSLSLPRACATGLRSIPAKLVGRPFTNLLLCISLSLSLSLYLPRVHGNAGKASTPLLKLNMQLRKVFPNTRLAAFRPSILVFVDGIHHAVAADGVLKP